MFYLIYLVGMFILLLATTAVKIIDNSVAVEVHQIANFIDIWSALPVLAFSVLALVCTKALKPMGDAFAFMFSKRSRPVQQLKENLLAVRTALWAAIASGGIFGVIRAVNLLRSLPLTDGLDSVLGYPSIAALLPLYYGLVIALVLFPISAALKQEIVRRDSGRQAKVSKQPETPVKNKG